MPDNSPIFDGLTNPLAALAIAAAILTGALFVAGRPDDLKGKTWQFWAVAALMVLVPVGLLTVSLSWITYEPCQDLANGVDC